MSVSIELTADQEQVLLGSSEAVSVVTKRLGQKYVLISAEAYDRMRELLRVDDIEPSLFEFDVPADLQRSESVSAFLPCD